MASSPKGLPQYFPHAKYGIEPGHVVQLSLGCSPDVIRSDVIITPCWPPDMFLSEADRVQPIAGDRVYDIAYKGLTFSLIRSGIGAPQTGDVVLSLGFTSCSRIIFTGSVGGLSPTHKIGDLLLPDCSIAGDGFSTYLGEGPLTMESFLRPALPDADLTEKLLACAKSVSDGSDITISRGTVFSIDTIVSQYQHLSWIMQSRSCIGIEMETSAVFNASRLVGIKAAALLQLSDVIPERKTLFSGRSVAERLRRKQIRESMLARALLETYKSNKE